MRIFLMILILHFGVNSNGQGALVLETYQTFAVIDRISQEGLYPDIQLEYLIKSPSTQSHIQADLYKERERTDIEDRISPHSIQFGLNTFIKPTDQSLYFKEIISQDPRTIIDFYSFSEVSEKVNYTSEKNIIRTDFSLAFIMRKKGSGINIGYLVEIARMDESYGLGAGIIINGLK